MPPPVLPIIKPDTTDVATTIYGIPRYTIGRSTYSLSGIVLHCLNTSINKYNTYMECSTPVSKRNAAKDHPSMHYGVSVNGNVYQYVIDSNVSWGFDEYTELSYPTPAMLDEGICWEPLNTANGGVSPDYYVVNIGLENVVPSGGGCVNCFGPTVLASDGYSKLVQLLAYLAETYSIPIDTGHIQFHESIICQLSPECPCADIDQIIIDVTNYCQACKYDAPELEIVACDEVTHLRARTDPVCNCCDVDCDVYVPFDNCFVGSVAAQDDITEGFLGLVDSGAGDNCSLCMVYGPINVTSPITGAGTLGDPLVIDRCLFDAFLPTSTIVTIVGIDASGCLVQASLPDSIFSEICEAPVNAGAVGYVIAELADTTCPVKVTPAQVVDAGLTVTPGNCVDIVKTVNDVAVEIIADPDACNAIVCGGNGLFVQGGQGTAVFNIVVPTFLAANDPVGTLPNTLTNLDAVQSVVVTNPSSCLNAIVLIDIEGLVLDARNTSGGAPAEIDFVFEYSLNGGGIWISEDNYAGKITIDPGSTDIEHLTSGAVVSTTLIPGASFTFQVRRLIANTDTNFSGNAVLKEQRARVTVIAL